MHVEQSTQEQDNPKKGACFSVICEETQHSIFLYWPIFRKKDVWNELYNTPCEVEIWNSHYISTAVSEAKD